MTPTQSIDRRVRKLQDAATTSKNEGTTRPDYTPWEAGYDDGILFAANEILAAAEDDNPTGRAAVVSILNDHTLSSGSSSYNGFRINHTACGSDECTWTAPWGSNEERRRAHNQHLAELITALR